MLRGVRVGLIVGAVGCGGPGTRPDAASDDGDIDSTVDTPPSGLVSVTVNSPVRQRVLDNAPVVFIAPDGTTTRVSTDAFGQASATVPPGTSVTVVFEENRGIATILGVDPGDQLVFGRGPIVSGTTLEVTFSAYPGDVDFYRINTPCFAFAVTPGTTPLSFSACAAPITNTDVLVIAYKDGVPVASAASQGVDLTSGAITIPNTWTMFSNIVLDYSNVAQLNVYASYSDTPENYTVSANANSPAYDVMLRVPNGAQSAYVHTTLSHSGRGTQQILEMLPTGATSYSLDVGAAAQPWLSEVSYTQATRTVAVIGSGGQNFDLVQYNVSFGHPSNALTWAVFSPDLNGVVLPALPADLDPAGDVLDSGVLTFETPTLTGWDAVRPNVYPLTTPQYSPVLPFGRVHMQVLFSQ